MAPTLVTAPPPCKPSRNTDEPITIVLLWARLQCRRRDAPHASRRLVGGRQPSRCGRLCLDRCARRRSLSLQREPCARCGGAGRHNAPADEYRAACGWRCRACVTGGNYRCARESGMDRLHLVHRRLWRPSGRACCGERCRGAGQWAVGFIPRSRERRQSINSSRGRPTARAGRASTRARPRSWIKTSGTMPR